MFAKILILALLAGAMGVLNPLGCQQYDDSGALRSASSCGFYVERVHLQPSFTEVNEHSASEGDGGGVEAYVQLRDQFGDPIKALGRFRFELFKYRPAFSDPRGQRFPQDGIQEIDLSEIRGNQQYWDPITRCYHITLSLPKLAPGLKQFVLQVTFSAEPDYRLQDILVLDRKK